jgi:DNA-binding NarL/FixJ family response regulator
MKKVVILTDYSLLAQGIASRLRQSSHSLEVELVDTRRPDVMSEVVRLQPQVVIFGSREVENSNICPLRELFSSLPNLMVIKVSLDNSNIQLIQSGQYKAAEFSDLVNMLEDVSGSFPEIASVI